MATGVISWSETAATNATADASVNWAEGQVPSSVNDSARAMMASAAKWRDDISGGLITGGTSTAYVLTTTQGGYAAPQDGAMLAFIVNATNGANPTISIDGGTARSIVTEGGGTPVPPGTLIASASYRIRYLASGSLWVLEGFYGNPYNLPISGCLLYFGSVVPNSNFAFANGAAVSRTTYATLFAIVGTTYGVGDGSTTFNLPNLSGRVPAGRESVASLLTATYFGGDSTALGATGGLQSHTLTTAQLAVTTPAGSISAITPAGSISAITPAGTVSGSSSGSDTIIVNGNTAQNLQGGTTGFGWSNSPTVKAIAAALSWAGSFTGTPTTPTFTGSTTTPTFTGSSFGSGSAHNNVQPTFVCNFIIRII